MKVRGFRIELGEIETVLARARRRGGRGRGGTGGGAHRRLAAYVVPREGQAPASAELAAWVRARLPEYMVPASVVVMDAFPRTSSGKLDRNSLPEPDFAPDAAAEHVEPRTETEALLAGIWAEVLGRDGIGVTERFWDIGGHSLLAMRVAGRIRHAAGAELPLRHFFEAPTIAALAERLERVLREDGPALADPILPRAADAPAPLSFAQERLLLIDRLRPGLTAYNIATGLRIRGALDVDALRRALPELVRRHASLRTRLVMAAGVPAQVIDAAAEIHLPMLDLSALGADAREAELRAHALALADAPFDLAADAPLRTSLVRLGEAEHALLLVIHHTAVDGWGVAVLYGELKQLYTAFAEGRTFELPPLPIQYTAHAARQRQWLQGATLERLADYWTGALAGAPPLLQLPTDRARPARQTYRGARLRVTLPAELTEALRVFSRRERVTLFMTLLAGFQVLLAPLYGQTDISVGTPIANRDRPATEPLIGFFVNTLVLRSRI